MHETPANPPASPHADHEHAGRGAGWRAHAALLRTRWGRALAIAVCVLALATVAGLVALWPAGAHRGPAQAFGGERTGAKVLRVLSVRCPGPVEQRCQTLQARVDDGPVVRLALGPEELTSSFDAGDRIRVERIQAQPGARNVAPYAFASVDRRGTLIWLTIAFAVLVVVMARMRGVLALAGFALSFLLVIKFIVPAILAGSPALLVSLVGCLAVMFVTVGLTYGLTAQSAAAALGIAGTLLFATLTGTLAVHAAKLDGRSSEIAIALIQTTRGVSLQGIVLAGLVLGSLGVLADMAVTQASAVMAVRRANPQLGMRRVYQEGFAVGRDHLVATTHTLVLAYAGATLPLLLVLQAVGTSTTDALNLHDVAEPLVAILIGAMALLISVPVTTALAAAVLSHIPVSALPEHDHSHHH